MNHELDIVQFIKKIRRLEENQKKIKAQLGLEPDEDDKPKNKN